MPVAVGRFVALLTCAGVATIAWSLFVGCTEGTTPDCSGNPSPCGYDQPGTGPGDASGGADEGGG